MVIYNLFTFVKNVKRRHKMQSDDMVFTFTRNAFEYSISFFSSENVLIMVT